MHNPHAETRAIVVYALTPGGIVPWRHRAVKHLARPIQALEIHDIILIIIRRHAHGRVGRHVIFLGRYSRRRRDKPLINFRSEETSYSGIDITCVEKRTIKRKYRLKISLLSIL